MHTYTHAHTLQPIVFGVVCVCLNTRGHARAHAHTDSLLRACTGAYTYNIGVHTQNYIHIRVFIYTHIHTHTQNAHKHTRPTQLYTHTYVHTLHRCVRTQKHAHIYTFKQAYTLLHSLLLFGVQYACTNKHTNTHTPKHTQSHTHKHTHAQTHIFIRTLHKCTHSHTHSIPVVTHTNIHTYIHTHTHIHIHTIVVWRRISVFVSPHAFEPILVLIYFRHLYMCVHTCRMPRQFRPSTSMH